MYIVMYIIGLRDENLSRREEGNWFGDPEGRRKE
jgi:hypothetical protein